MWFECAWCGYLLPLYLMDNDSAKYMPMEDCVCQECAWDLQREHCEDEDYDPCDNCQDSSCTEWGC